MVTSPATALPNKSQLTGQFTPVAQLLNAGFGLSAPPPMEAARLALLVALVAEALAELA
jgi:hypothetical protein